MPVELGPATFIEISKDDLARLYHETDARFVAQTGVTRKLNPKNAIDQKWIPIWAHLFDQVRQQFLDGTIRWTYDHPDVAQAVSDARAADAAFGREVAQILTSKDPHQTPGGPPVAQAVQNAQHAAAASSAAATKAAAIQGKLGAGLAIPLAAISDVASWIASGVQRGDQLVGDVADAAMAIRSQDAPAHAAVAQAAAQQAAQQAGQQPAYASAVPPGQPAKTSVLARPFPWKIAIPITAGIGLVALAAAAGGGSRTRWRGARR